MLLYNINLQQKAMESDDDAEIIDINSDDDEIQTIEQRKPKDPLHIEGEEDNEWNDDDDIVQVRWSIFVTIIIIQYKLISFNTFASECLLLEDK